MKESSERENTKGIAGIVSKEERLRLTQEQFRQQKIEDFNKREKRLKGIIKKLEADIAANKKLGSDVSGQEADLQFWQKDLERFYEEKARTLSQDSSQ